MLDIKQFEGELYLITVKTDGVDFSGLFQLVDGIPSKDLIPADNGLHIRIDE